MTGALLEIAMPSDRPDHRSCRKYGQA